MLGRVGGMPAKGLCGDCAKENWSRVEYTGLFQYFSDFDSSFSRHLSKLSRILSTPSYFSLLT